MKRIITILISALSLLCLCSCGGSGSKATAPDVICLNNKSVSYYDTEIPDEFWDADVEFNVNSDNQIRNITITSSDVETYNGISVGDSINEVESKFKYEANMKHIYMVVFSGNKEIEVGTQEATTEYLVITYFCDEDDKIETITICDALYAKTMK